VKPFNEREAGRGIAVLLYCKLPDVCMVQLLLIARQHASDQGSSRDLADAKADADAEA